MRRIAVALLLLVLPPYTSAAADEAKIHEEFSKQERIYRIEDWRTRGYTIDRGLALYTDSLASDFERSLESLGPAHRWLDVGAGQGQAVIDYFRNGPGRAQAVAMSIEDRRTPQWRQTASRLGANQIRYLADKRLQDYSAVELGQFELISDVIGGFSYTRNLSVFMEKVLGFLKVDGDFYTVLQDVHWANGDNQPYYKGSPFLTEIADATGAEVKVCAWLKRISCVEVTCESKPGWEPPVEAFRVHKVCDDVRVPPLSLIRYQAGTPPERAFVTSR